MPAAARFITPLLAVFAFLAGFPQFPAARQPSLDDVVKRVVDYVAAYGPELATIVAEERYTQRTEQEPGTFVIGGDGVSHRVLRSDFALARLDDGRTWAAFRDVYEVDGRAVRGRDNRLMSLLSSGASGWRQAAALTNESARFNIGSPIARNVNVPTFVIQLLQAPNHRRFRFSRPRGSDDEVARAAVDGGVRPPRWTIEFRERDRPTLVRQSNGGDQPLRGTISVDPETGAVWGTTLTWERGPAGHITVTFDHVDDFDVLVPVRMVEQYRGQAMVVSGDATYSNFRRFEGSARILSGAEAPPGDK